MAFCEYCEKDNCGCNLMSKPTDYEIKRPEDTNPHSETDFNIMVFSILGFAFLMLVIIPLIFR